MLKKIKIYDIIKIYIQLKSFYTKINYQVNCFNIQTIIIYSFTFDFIVYFMIGGCTNDKLFIHKILLKIKF